MAATHLREVVRRRGRRRLVGRRRRYFQRMLRHRVEEAAELRPDLRARRFGRETAPRQLPQRRPPYRQVRSGRPGRSLVDKCGARASGTCDTRPSYSSSSSAALLTKNCGSVRRWCVKACAAQVAAHTRISPHRPGNGHQSGSDRRRQRRVDKASSTKNIHMCFVV